MIVRILGVVAACIVILFIAFWIWSGGISRTIAAARTYDNPIAFFMGSSTGSTIRLPWQPDTGQFGATIADDSAYSGNEYVDPGTSADPAQTLSNLQEQYSQLSKLAREAKTFGDPSPYRGKVAFEGNDSAGTSAAEEFIRIRANNVTAPVSLTGWSLQSVVSGVRISLPSAASPLVAGALNNVSSVSLAPEASATIVSGPSPVGVSFQENQCTGYLAELQPFTPDLDRQCVSPADEMPLTPENIQIYGDTCIDYMRTVPPCHFPGKDSANISPACRNFAINQLSYNGCVYAHRNDVGFASPSWRLYLTSAVKLWRPTHDVIRLLDEQGRTVDVLTY